MKKLTIEEMMQIAQNRGGKCLSKTYINSSTKLLWECAQGHKWQAIPDSVKRGSWCAECAGLKKCTIEQMIDIARAKGGRCLSAKYINDRTKLKWQCGKGHIWEATPNHIKSGFWCAECAGNKKLTIKEMHKIAIERGGRCLSKEYINSKTLLKWQCSRGHTWEASASKIRQGRWCHKCGGTKKLSIGKLKAIAEDRGGKCLSYKYVNAHEKLRWCCSEGHIWKAPAMHIRAGHWCPECSIGLGERVCRTIFEQLFKEPFPKARPSWLLNREGNQMELDGYCEELSLAFEHQGKQHYVQVDRFQSIEEHEKLKKNDQDKRRLCKQFKVILITIPDILKFTQISKAKDYIIRKCEKGGLGHLFSEIGEIEFDLKDAYTPESKKYLIKLQKIAKKRGGKCLSNHYLGSFSKLYFQCAKGHVWKAAPTYIFSGHWCHECGGYKRLSIEDMNTIAREKGGKCISKEYINGKSKLRWQCGKGHIWEAIPNNIIRGHWCPICAGVAKGNIDELHEIARKRKGRCLSNVYVNNKTKLKWQCRRGHIWEATPKDIKRGKWCWQCYNIRRRKKM